MIDFPDVDLAPMMTGVPAVTAESIGAIDTMPGTGAVVVGATHVPGSGPALVVGVKRRDGSSTLGVTSLEHAERFHAALGKAIRSIRSGAFDSAPQGQ